MIFDDADLKRLKDCAERVSKASKIGPLLLSHCQVDPSELNALIARLEAAEQCFSEPDCECTTVELGCWHETSYLKWLQACGRSK